MKISDKRGAAIPMALASFGLLVAGCASTDSAQLDIASAATKMDKPEALESARKESAVALELEGKALSEIRAGRWLEALPLLDLADAKDPKRFFLLGERIDMMRVTVLSRLGRWKVAQETAERIYKPGVDDLFDLDYAILLSRSEEDALLKKLLPEIRLPKGSTLASLLAARAKTLHTTGRSLEASLDYEESLKLEPDNPETAFSAGRNYVNMNRREDAKKMFRLAAKYGEGDLVKEARFAAGDPQEGEESN
ncbi:MAG: hypothetical protein EON58_13735 [Alphaproteobacteria bacterium]|nr:MAG: hypothetical protein EON58_13735 [Alphaproteobacteria bacterium]